MSAFSYAAAQVFRVLPRESISRAAGRLATVRWSGTVGEGVVRAYSNLYRVDLADCAQKSGWSCFDSFFTRSLREGSRPIHGDESTIVSPADGSLETIAAINDNTELMVKGRPYQVDELVGSSEESHRYRGGFGFVVYLSPRDYHRVHSPVSGTLARIHSIPGDYYPVNRIGVAHVDKLFARNRRVVFGIDAADEIGRVTVIMVAAIVVGRISSRAVAGSDVPFGVHRPNYALARGDELGIFHLGSTAVVLLEKKAASKVLAGYGPIMMGAPLALRGAA